MTSDHLHTTSDDVHGVRKRLLAHASKEQGHGVTMEAMPRAKAIDPNAACFGTIVYGMRSDRGWTLDDLAKVSGMNADWLGVLERGLNVPSLTTILRLADAFGVEAAALVREVDLARRPAD